MQGSFLELYLIEPLTSCDCSQSHTQVILVVVRGDAPAATPDNDVTCVGVHLYITAVS